MDWNRTALIFFWGLFLLMIGGAVALVVTAPDRELPYVYAPAKMAKSPNHAEENPGPETSGPEVSNPETGKNEFSAKSGGSSVEPLSEHSLSGQLKKTPAVSGKAKEGLVTPKGKKPEMKASGTQDASKTAPKGDPRPAWQKYASGLPYSQDKPRIAVVVSGLGLSRAATNAAIRQLPPQISLSFSPYARRLDNWIALSRSLAHETLIDLPLEPADYPKDDPGPRTLLSAADSRTNLENLDWVSGRGRDIIGLTAFMGERFVTSSSQMNALFSSLKTRGLAFLDNGLSTRSLTSSAASANQVPYAVASSIIDNTQLSRVVIDSKLAQIERLAIKNGSVVALGRPYPVTLERLTNWAGELAARGIQLVPLSAVLNRPQTPDAKAGKDVQKKHPS